MFADLPGGALPTIPAPPRHPRASHPDLVPEPIPGRERYLADLRGCMRGRWESGQCASVETFLVEFPQLVDDPGAVLQLLLEEYDLRHEHGEEPTLQEAATRFPSFVKPLAQHLQFRQAARRFNEAERISRGNPIDRPSPR